MKRLYYAIALCLGLLIFEAAVFIPASSAKEDVIQGLLQMPAPPPPNPLSRGRRRSRDDDFYNKSKPPGDNASIDDILDYWARMSESIQDLRYSPQPSEKTLDRLMDEIEKKPELLPDYLNVLKKDEKTAAFVKQIYDREGANGDLDREARVQVRNWLMYNSTYFSSDLQRLAAGAGDTDTYVSNQRELLALARVDWEKAKPLIDRLQMGDSRKASRSLAAWANYLHAIETDSIGDIERYRDELKSIVEDKTLSAPMRDLAMDALVAEKDWPGRDDWYMSLLADETLADMGGYTGLTTLMLVSPEEKYIEKMVELLKSDNPVVRAAAVRNLLTRLSTKNPEIIKAMLPWLEDKSWARENNDERRQIVDALRYLQIPESVPGLLKVLDEKGKRPVYDANTASNAMANAVNAMAYAANTAANAANTAAPYYSTTNRAVANAANSMRAVSEETYFPYRTNAIWALGRQEDPRAGPPLRRILNEVEIYERGAIISALLACKGFSIAEQLDALETAVRQKDSAIASMSMNANLAANAVANYPYVRPGPMSAAELKIQLGLQLMESTDVSNELANAVVDRIGALATKDPKLADMLRKVVLRWPNAAVNMMLLRDVKNDRTSADAVLRLLSQRKQLRETQPSDVFDLRTGTATAVGIAACMIEDAAEYTAILDGENVESKIALFACARLIRAPIPVAKAAEFVRSGDKRLALAAERYLESEDSPAARAAVLALHPNEAKIMGATTAFFVDNSEFGPSEFLAALFASVGIDVGMGGAYGIFEGAELKQEEAKLIKEVKADSELMGVYSFDGNFVRMYKDKVMFSWDYDGSRYRERALDKPEFDELKTYLAQNRVDELTPFLECGEREYCAGKELVMVGRGGGRRVYVSADTLPPFFAGLEKYFKDLKAGGGTVRYELSKEIPGLEILLADDDLHAETVWKNGDDMRVAVSDKKVQEKVDEEINKSLVEDPPDENSDPNVSGAAAEGERRATLAEKRQYDSYSWRRIINGVDAGIASQPPDVELIPIRDGHAVQGTEEQWKARALGVEIRANDDGLFKLARGNFSRLHDGYYASPIVTPNGRWVVAYHYDSENGPKLMRVNLVTNRRYPVEIEEYMTYYPYAYVATLNKILLVAQDEHGEYEETDGELGDMVDADVSPSDMMLVDPETGRLQPASGEFRPLAQQTFRPLQRTARLNEYWAAMPDHDKNETLVGIYDTKLFGFKTILKVPKMTFNSMTMWVDEPAKVIYFVYRGHLLKLPLPKP